MGKIYYFFYMTTMVQNSCTMSVRLYRLLFVMGSLGCVLELSGCGCPAIDYCYPASYQILIVPVQPTFPNAEFKVKMILTYLSGNEKNCEFLFHPSKSIEQENAECSAYMLAVSEQLQFYIKGYPQQVLLTIEKENKLLLRQKLQPNYENPPLSLCTIGACGVAITRIELKT